jgi:hypothetical protein
MAVNTVQTTVKVPKPMLESAHERWPEMSNGQILRYALARALGGSESDALAATRDARIVTRKLTTE